MAPAPGKDPVARVITARFRGVCKDCGGSFPAGERIRFAGRGRTFHVDCDTNSTGPVTTYGGRCEDAPCCGHSGCGFGPSSPGYGSYVGGSPYYGEDF